MRNMKILILLSLSAIFALNGVGHAQKAKSKDTRNVWDYYKLVEKNLIPEGVGKPKILVKDIENGFLKIHADKDKLQLNVALFRKNNGEAILVVIARELIPEISTFSSAYVVYELSNEPGQKIEMEDVTGDVLPTLSGRENLELFNKKRKQKNVKAEFIVLDIKLPRKGQVIKFFARTMDGEETLEEKVKIYEMHLKDDKFVIVKN